MDRCKYYIYFWRNISFARMIKNRPPPTIPLKEQLSFHWTNFLSALIIFKIPLISLIIHAYLHVFESTNIDVHILYMYMFCMLDQWFLTFSKLLKLRRPEKTQNEYYNNINDFFHFVKESLLWSLFKKSLYWLSHILSESFPIFFLISRVK